MTPKTPPLDLPLQCVMLSQGYMIIDTAVTDLPFCQIFPYVRSLITYNSPISNGHKWKPEGVCDITVKSVHQIIQAVIDIPGDMK